MDIIRVPHALFKEFSQKFGTGEEGSINNDRYYYFLFRKLDSETVGFPGAIGLRDDSSKNDPRFIFALWGMIPKIEFDLKPALIITARAESAGAWAVGKGRRMKETCKAEFDFYGMNLRYPSSKLIPLILQRAVELVSQAQSDEFWENERNPEGNFIRPP